MKCLARFLALLALITVSTTAVSASPASDKIQLFIEKLKKTSSQTDKEPGRGMDRGATVAQLQMMHALLLRGENEKARLMIESIPLYTLAPDMQQEWIDISGEVSKEIRQAETDAQEKFRAEVDQLINDVHKACLQATKSADLDPLLIRCAALQMRRSTTSDILSNRTTQKLAGAADTLQAFAKFLDFSAAGKVEAANRTLEELTNNAANFPVMSVAELKSRLASDDNRPANLPQAIAGLTANAKTPDDFDHAIEQAKKMIANPSDASSRYRPEFDSIGTLAAAWADAKSGSDDVALRNLYSIPKPGSPLSAFYSAVTNAIVQRLIEHKLATYTSSSPWKPEQPLADYFDKLLTGLQEKQDFAGMIEVLKFCARLPDSLGLRSLESGEQQHALEKFLSARRFESAGDVTSAVGDYRMVVESPGKFSPTKLATDALSKLQQAHPEVFKDYEGAVLQEMHALREQMRATQSMGPRGPSAPFIPGR